MTRESYRSSPAESLAAEARRLRRDAPFVHAEMPWGEHSLAPLVDALHRLAQDRRLWPRLAESAHLSEPMVRWALETSVESITHELLRDLAQRAGLFGPEAQQRARLCVVALAGNVFTAGIRPIVLALAHGLSVLVRPSSRERALPEALAAALPPPFDRAIHVAPFDHGDDARWRALFAHADVVHAYGSDDTLAQLRTHAPVGATFIGHGHGLGAAVLLPARGVVPEPTVLDQHAADALARDVVAYDQRGCLSPRVLFIEGDAAAAHQAAEALHSALIRLETELPRGPVDLTSASALAQWRGTALALGALHESETHAVAVDEHGHLPLGPGLRHLVVRPLPGRREIRAALAQLGAAHLNALGLRAPLSQLDARHLTHELLSDCATPRVSRFGAMQRPPIDAWLDGLEPALGLVRR